MSDNHGDINRRMSDSGVPEEVEPSDVNPDLDTDRDPSEGDDHRAREEVHSSPTPLEEENDPVTGMPARTSIYRPGS